MSFYTVAAFVYTVYENIGIANDNVGVDVNNTEFALDLGLVEKIKLEDKSVVKSGRTKTVESPLIIAEKLTRGHPPVNIKLLPTSVQFRKIFNVFFFPLTLLSKAFCR